MSCSEAQERMLWCYLLGIHIVHLAPFYPTWLVFEPRPFRCSSTRTVPPCGGSICCSRRATSATSLCQRSTLPTESVWARSVLFVMAAWCLIRPCQELRRICWVIFQILFSLISPSRSILRGPMSVNSHLSSYPSYFYASATLGLIRMVFGGLSSGHWKLLLGVLFFSSRHLHPAVSLPASVWSLREGNFSVPGYDRLYIFQTWQRTRTVHQAAGKHTHWWSTGIFL